MKNELPEDSPVATAKEVALWMHGQIAPKKPLYQDQAANSILRHFGSQFVHYNANGNLAIDKNVLKEFRACSQATIVWEKGERCWRLLREGEACNGRQVE